MTDLRSDPPPFTAGDILNRTGTLLRHHAPGASLALALLSAAGFAVDAAAPAEAEGLALLALSLLAVAAQYRLTRSVLRELAGQEVAGATFGSFFLQGLTATLGILAGLILLIVPGLVLMARWWIAAPILLDSRMGIAESLAASWRMTEGRFVPIFLAVIVVYVPAFAVIVVAQILLEAGLNSFVAFAIFNLVFYVACIAGWFTALAVFSFFRHAGPLRRVFE